MTPQHTIYALTLIRPWCWAIVHGFKPIENRVWTPPEHVMGQRIAIHSGQKYDDLGAADIDSLIDHGHPPISSAWPGGRLVGSVRVDGYARHDGNGGLIGWSGVSKERASEAARDSWTANEPGVAWILSDARATEPIDGVRGYQKLWLVEQSDYSMFMSAPRVKLTALAGGKP